MRFIFRKTLSVRKIAMVRIANYVFIYLWDFQLKKYAKISCGAGQKAR